MSGVRENSRLRVAFLASFVVCYDSVANFSDYNFLQWIIIASNS